MKCNRCLKRLDVDEDIIRRCSYCFKYLCDKCWKGNNQHCGHIEVLTIQKDNKND